MNIKGYLKQSCTLHSFVSEDGDGAPTFAAPQTIRCRKTRKVKQANKKRFQQLVDITVFLTEEEVNPGDRLDGETIQAVENYVDFDGEIIGYSSYPKPPVSFSTP